MPRKFLPLLLIAFAVAVVSTGVFYGLIVGKLRSSEARPKPQVVVAARSLPRGTVIEKSHVRLSAWTGPGEPKGALTDPDQVVGLTVLQAIEDGQPVAQESLSARSAGAGAAQAIPSGMRAASIHVAESPGVIAMLRPGHRVDVQAVRNRNSPNGADAELRTVLQNMEVLSVQPEGNQGRQGAAIVTLLAKPAEADALGVADAAARLRLLLRNPSDREREARSGLLLASLFQPVSMHQTPPALRAAAPGRDSSPPPRPPASTTAADAQVQLHVRIAGASAAALEQLSSRLLTPRRADLLQVSAFRPGWDLENAVESFCSQRLLEVLSSTNLVTASNREVSLQAGARWNAAGASAADGAGLRVQFVPLVAAGRKLHLRVQPEITSARGEGVATRKIETEVELSDGQSFLVSGLVEPRDGGSLVARLFPGHAPANSELVVLATPQLVKPAGAERRTSAMLQKR